MNKKERATALLAKIKELGIKAEISGKWVNFTPPPSIDVQIEAAQLGDQLFELVSKGES